MRKTDDELTRLLKSDPEKGMEELVEQYTGLVWTIAAGQLDNIEDVKECVNDTFAEFYRQKDRFDDTRGTLSAYLGAIAKNRAISKYQKNKIRFLQEPLEDVILSDTSDAIDSLEWKMVLEQAMSVLSTEELNIVRMKYYENMTVREIAEALNIPYETVKKRHQRSIGKMKKALIALLILVLVTLLTACAYIVLRYFGVVPGYGINTNEESGIYVLEETAAAENKDLLLQIEDATFINGEMVIYLRKTKKSPDYYNLYDDDTLYYEGKTYSSRISGMDWSDSEELLRFVYSNLPMPDKRTEIYTVNFEYAEIPLTFNLVQAEETPAEQYSMDLVDDTGLLAIPRIENGELIVSIYPLDSREVQIAPSLVKSIYEEYDSDTAPITLTDTDGNMHEGICVGYSPFNPALYFDWNFGALPAGNYTLHVPYVYENLRIPDDFSVLLDLKNGVDTETVYDFDNFTFQIAGCESVSIEEIPSAGETILTYDESKDYWLLHFKASFRDPNRYMVGINLDRELNPVIGSSFQTVEYTKEGCTSLLLSLDAEREKLPTIRLLPSDSMTGPYLVRRWDQEFNIDITVESEEL